MEGADKEKVPWHVHKFGGTSVANSACFRTVKRIIEDELDKGAAAGAGTTAAACSRVCVVVSAMGGVPKTTNLLLELVKRAAKNEDYSDTLEMIRAKHLRVIQELFLGQEDEATPGSSAKPSTKEAWRPSEGEAAKPPAGVDIPTPQLDALTSSRVSNAGSEIFEQDKPGGARPGCLGGKVEQHPLAQRILADLGDIEKLLHAVNILRHPDERMANLIAGYGELWSAQILSMLMNFQAGAAGEKQKGEEEGRFFFVDARNIIFVKDDIVSGSTGPVMIDWEMSSGKVAELLSKKGGSGKDLKCPIVTGFIASSSRHGGATTLGRDGSDFSASIMGKLLKAEDVCIWTDVSGILSADPRKVPDAYTLPRVSYQECWELACFGAKVVHPSTTVPAMEESIPVIIKNTFAPKDKGTIIGVSDSKTMNRKTVVCGFSTCDGVSLVNLEGAGMPGCCGISARAFSRLAQESISIMFIAQAISEQTICIGVKSEMVEKASRVLGEAFEREIRLGLMEQVKIEGECSTIAAVGDGLKKAYGMAGKLFSALGEAHVNILAIAQGCSERNVSAVIKTRDAERALRAAHSAFMFNEDGFCRLTSSPAEV